MGRLRILLVDDHVLLRSALRAVLDGQPDMEVVGEAGDGREAVKEALRLTPEIILLDMSMPGMSGPEAAGHLKRALPASRILALSAHEDEAFARQMLEAGADGFVPKSSSPTELLHAIHRVAAGERYLEPDMALRLGEADDAQRELTPDETEVLRRFARGFPMKQIASALGFELEAAERHKARGMRKLGLKTRADVVRLAAERGWS